jgi:S1-C subfamily serine protease
MSSLLPTPDGQTPAGQASTGQTAPGQTAADGFIAQNVAKTAIPGVVGMQVLQADGNSVFDKNFSQQWGVGSGIIVDSSGYILTNHHVVGDKRTRIIVSLSDGRNVDGTTVWTEAALDLAIVKVDLTGLPVIPIGDSSGVNVGEPAIAIGNPLGLQFQRTVTQGIISALDRTIKVDNEQGGSSLMEDLIQTDASINPGNSGGPLLNSKGQVIGVNTIKVTSAESMGFAIPINVVVPVIRQVVEKGSFTEAYLGVFAYDKDLAMYADPNLKLDKGIYLVDIDQNGPAYKAGLRVGSIITNVGGQDINKMIQLRTAIYSRSPNDVIDITYIIDGKTITTSVKLEASPSRSTSS